VGFLSLLPTFGGMASKGKAGDFLSNYTKVETGRDLALFNELRTKDNFSLKSFVLNAEPIYEKNRSQLLNKPFMK